MLGWPVAAGGEARVYLITQYTHPRELTQESVRASGSCRLLL